MSFEDQEPAPTMYIFFADDAAQSRPTRSGVGSLVASGGLFIEANAAASLEKSIDLTCRQFGFPNGEEFKWSPGPTSWMRTNLIGQNRRDFFLSVIQTCRDHDAIVTVVISDETSQTPASSADHQEFVTKMLIERIDWLARSKHTTALIVADRPGGNRTTERMFLLQCLEAIQKGTGYVTPRHIAFNTLSTDSHLVRMLQAADLCVSSVTSFVAGENVFSPTIFAAIRPLLASDFGRVGGVGLKLHPDYSYVNLYHWLLGDTHRIRNMGGWPLPILRYKYATSPNTP